MRQFKPNEWTVADQLTITPEFLQRSSTFIKGLFAVMIKFLQQQGQRPGAAVPPQQPQQQPGDQATRPPLSTTNLQQHQQQQEALLRARRAQQQPVPPAPAAVQPGVAVPPLGAPSPQGVPQAYGPGSNFSPDKLRIPPSKKRKQTHTSAPASEASATAPAKTDTVKAETKAFPCPVMDCEYNQNGFTTQEALDKHTQEFHPTREQIGDPLQYALESFAAALAAPPKEKEKESAGARAGHPAPTDTEPAHSETKPGAAPVDSKADGAAAVPSAPTAGTNMGRMASQPGPTSASPATNQLATPRTVPSKAPSESKATADKDSKKEPTKPADQAATQDVVMKDEWLDSAISLDLIHDSFGAIANDDFSGLGVDPFDEFLNSDMFVSGQTENTPDSVDSGLVTQTPKDGEDAAVKIRDSEDDNRLPADWIGHPGPITTDMLTFDDSWLDTDWSVLEQKDREATAKNDLSQTVFSI